MTTAVNQPDDRRVRAISDLVASGDNREAVRLIQGWVHEVRRGNGRVASANAARLAELSWTLQLWPETEFWARAGLSTTGSVSRADVARIVVMCALVVTSLIQQGNPTAAADEAERMSADLPEGADEFSYFQFHLNAGVALYRGERSDAALAEFARADRYAGSVDDDLRGALELNRGSALRSAGRAEEALAAWQAALPVIADDLRGRVLVNLANALSDLDRVDEAERHYMLAWEADEDPENRGALLSNLAHLRLRKGQDRQARRMLEEAVELRERAGDRVGLAKSLGSLAVVVAKGYDYRTASTLFERSMQIRRELGLPEEQADVGIAGYLADMVARLEASDELAASAVVNRLIAAEGVDEMAEIIEGERPASLQLALTAIAVPLAGDSPKHGAVARFLSRSLEVGVRFALAEEEQRQARLNDLVRDLATLSRTEIWLDQKRFYESRREKFEDDLALNVRPWMEENAADLETSVEALAAIHTLIAECKRIGVDRAFAELASRHEGELLNRLTMVGTWRETRCLVEAHSDFYLSDSALTMLEETIEVGLPAHRQHLVTHRDLLRRCQEVGIEQAFAEVLTSEVNLRGQKLIIGSVATGRETPEDASEEEKSRHFIAVMDQIGNTVMGAMLRMDLAKKFLQRTGGDRRADLDEAARLLLEARPMLIRHVYPHLHASILTYLGHAFAELSTLDPADRSLLEAAVEAYTSLLDALETDVDPQRVRTAAGGLDDTLPSVMAQAETAAERERLRRLHVRACRAAMAATDALVRTGDVLDSQDEIAASFWAYAGAVDDFFELGNYGDALLSAERGRGRGFLSEVGRMAELPDYVPVALAQRESAARERVRQARSTQSEDPLPVAERELREVQVELAAVSPEFGRLRAGESPTLQELRDFAHGLSERTVVLAWYTTPEGGFVFAVPGGGTTVLAERIQMTWAQQGNFCDLASVDLWRRPSHPDQQLSPGWRGLMASLIPQSWQGLLSNVDNIILVPHGLLHELPLHALPVEWLGSRPLIELARVEYLPTITVAQRLRDRARGGDSAVVLAHSGGQTPSEFDLEARQVAGDLGTDRVFIGADASLSRVLEHGPRASILHVAAHGYFDPADPMGGGVILSNVDGEGTETLSPDLIVRRLRLPGTVVVLSACETNRRRLQPTDESEGLVRAFLVAGASAVVASQWRVDSAATRQLMAGFYRELIASGDVPTSLRLSTLDLRGAAATRHPYYWAPFVATGV